SVLLTLEHEAAEELAAAEVPAAPEDQELLLGEPPVGEEVRLDRAVAVVGDDERHGRASPGTERVVDLLARPVDRAPELEKVRGHLRHRLAHLGPMLVLEPVGL